MISQCSHEAFLLLKGARGCHPTSYTEAPHSFITTSYINGICTIPTNRSIRRRVPSPCAQKLILQFGVFSATSNEYLPTLSESINESQDPGVSKVFVTNFGTHAMTQHCIHPYNIRLSYCK